MLDAQIVVRVEAKTKREVERIARKAKRKMSAEGRKRIIEATRKRWEAYRAEKAAAANG